MQAEREKVIRLLKTARGQMDGILKMVEENRYCIDISNQLLATESIIRKVNKEIIHAHMTHCVKDAIKNGDSDDKMNELFQILDKMSR